MADTFSFDIVSKVDKQEVTNAVNQAMREISTRYDFKGTKSSIEWNEKENTLLVLGDDEMRLKSVVDILQDKCIKRSISIKALDYGPVEEAAGGAARQKITVTQGIDKERAKEIVKAIKEMKKKVQASIQDEQVRVSGAKKDDLQDVMTMVRGQDFGIPLQFSNYR